MNIRFPDLFSPLKVRDIILNNRIYSAPVSSHGVKLISGNDYGHYLMEDVVRSGCAGIIINGHAPADIAGRKDSFDKYAQDVTREILSIMESKGGVGIIEIPFHPEINEDKTIQYPSDGIAANMMKAKAMTKSDMDDAIRKLCNECKKAKDFGFRMIMLHFGHDSLNSLFLSPIWNKRNDEYGGSIENRSRFSLEAIKEVRKTLGDDYPIMMRISRSLMVKETYSEEDMLYFIEHSKEYVDIYNISCGMDIYGGNTGRNDANVHHQPTFFEKHFYNLDFCEKIKKNIDTLVCISGAADDPCLCDEYIRQGKIDMVMLGRALIADPFWTKKALSGDIEDIVPCLRCNYCYHTSTDHFNVQCSVNPRLRRENRVPLKLDKSDNPKNVVIIGGGPAGMKAALTADEKGHKVTLIEKENELGGKLNLIGNHPIKSDLNRYKNYLIHHINNSNIKVMLNTCADNKLIESLKPDVVLIAIGGELVRPDIKGVEYAKQATDCLISDINNIEGNVIIIGGGSIGSELAIELGEAKKHVTLIEMSDKLAANQHEIYRISMHQHLDPLDNVDVMLESKVIEIRKNGVLVEHQNREVFVEADHIYLAVGIKSDKNKVFEFYNIVPETYMIGDCRQVGSILTATNDSYFVASNIE